MKREMSGTQGIRVFEKPMSVGQVSSVCYASKKTILNWIYTKRLKVHTTLGGHYRIWPGDLKKFMAEAGIDVPFEFSEKRYKTILIMGYEADSEKQLKAAINRGTNQSEVICSDNFAEVLLTTGYKKPALIVLNWDTRALSADEVGALLNWQKSHPFKLALSSSYDNHVFVMRNMFQSAKNGQVMSGSPAEILNKIPELLKSSDTIP